MAFFKLFKKKEKKLTEEQQKIKDFENLKEEADKMVSNVKYTLKEGKLVKEDVKQAAPVQAPVVPPQMAPNPMESVPQPIQQAPQNAQEAMHQRLQEQQRPYEQPLREQVPRQVEQPLRVEQEQLQEEQYVTCVILLKSGKPINVTVALSAVNDLAVRLSDAIERKGTIVIANLLLNAEEIEFCEFG